MIAWPAKDPAEVLEFTWTVPVDAGDTVASYTVVKSSGAVILDSHSQTGANVTVWISGGAADGLNYFSLTATTNGGRTFREGAVLPVIDRASELLAKFRLRFPTFAGIDDGRIGYWLADAGSFVGSQWGDDADTGRTVYAAHKLAESGAVSEAVPQGLTSFKSGTFSATVSDKIAGATGFAATLYGREFMEMQRVLFSGPMMAWTPPSA
jgi:Protein of unknown function (DUF4054)